MQNGCITPLPKDSADPVLTRMLARAPYQVPSEGDKEGSGEVKSGLHTGGTLHTTSGGIGTPVSESKRRGESNIPYLRGRKGPPERAIMLLHHVFDVDDNIHVGD